MSEEDQATMFPELEDNNPKHKAVLSAARRFAKAKAERDALLGSSKEKCDGLMGKVIAAMHEARLKKFRHKGVQAEILETKERVEVKVEEESGGDEE